MVTAPPDDERMFIAEQSGTVVIVEGGAVAGTMLDLTSEVSTGNEQGLLGLAFYPNFTVTGRFFVSYTDRDGRTNVVEYEADPASGVADPTSARVILQVDQPDSNHNGGHIEIGPDRTLYVGLGDGGGAGDPGNHGQNLSTLLGSILRLDVSGTAPYTIPPDNPFVDQSGVRPEIWAYGLRNPWRFSVDGPTGQVYIGDVGQNDWEEINVAPVDQPGRNFGWRIMEGADCFTGPGCGLETLTLPALVVGHDPACSITGGHIYRGQSAPSLAGRFLFSDFCAGWIRAATPMGEQLVDITQLSGTNPGSVTSFGRDGQGESYVLTIAGRLYLITE